MSFAKTFTGTTYVVSNALLQPGQSVVMDANYVAPDGSLRSIPYGTRGAGLTVDAAGVERRHGVGDTTESEVYAQGPFTMVITEEADYWCLNPLPGNRIVREGLYVVAPGQSAVIDKGNIVNALFMDNALVNGIPVSRGQVARLSTGPKEIIQPEGRELHVILFNTQPSV